MTRPSILLALVGLLVATDAIAEGRRVMVFGDSLTWGWVPQTTVPTTRFADNVRWAGVLRADLGDGYQVIEEALNGRTTNVSPDPNPIPVPGAGLNGAAYLPAAIASHLPLDLVVILLGTNDLWADRNRSALAIGLAAMELVTLVQAADHLVNTVYPAPKVLLIAPPPLAPQVTESIFAPVFGNAVAKSRELGPVFGALAAAAGIPFLNAGDVTPISGIDGVHFTAGNHQALGHAVARKVQALLGAGAP